MSRGDLTEEGWQVIEPLLPAERGRWGRPAQNNRKYVNGMLWVLRTGAPWRDLGVWEAVLAALSDSLEDNNSYSIDSTIIRGHAQAAGAKGGLKGKRLVVCGEASPVKFTASAMQPEGRSSSGSRAGKRRTAKRTKC